MKGKQAEISRKKVVDLDIQNKLVICYSAWIHESATDAVKIFNRRAEATSGLAMATAEDLQVKWE